MVEMAKKRVIKKNLWSLNNDHTETGYKNQQQSIG